MLLWSTELTHADPSVETTSPFCPLFHWIMPSHFSVPSSDITSSFMKPSLLIWFGFSPLSSHSSLTKPYYSALSVFPIRFGVP